MIVNYMVTELDHILSYVEHSMTTLCIAYYDYANCDPYTHVV
jgi:hypothetical protein